MLTDRCLLSVCLSACLRGCLCVPSVTLTYCGQTVGWIKMKLGMNVGLGLDHIVLDGEWRPRSPTQKGGTAPPILAHVVWPNGCMDQDATWYGGRPRPRQHCLSKKRAEPPPQIFGPCGQTAGWIKMPLGMEVGLGPGHNVLDRDPAPPPKKGAEPPIFGPYVCCGQTAGSMDQDATWYGLRR